MLEILQIHLVATSANLTVETLRFLWSRPGVC